MSEIIETYQEEQEIRPEEPKEIAYATVTQITAGGLIVRFDGETDTSTKAYPFNIAGQFAVNDRALMQKINGEYVAMCPVGVTPRGGGVNIETISTGRYTVDADEKYESNIQAFTGVVVSVDCTAAEVFASANVRGGRLYLQYMNMTATRKQNVYFYIHVIRQ